MSLVVTEAVISDKIIKFINDDAYRCSFIFKLKGFDERFSLTCVYDKGEKMDNWYPNIFHFVTNYGKFQSVFSNHPIRKEALSVLEQIQSFVRNELFLDELKHGIVRKYH